MATAMQQHGHLVISQEVPRLHAWNAAHVKASPFHLDPIFLPCFSVLPIPLTVLMCMLCV